MRILVALCLVFSFLIVCNSNNPNSIEEINSDPGFVIDVDGNVYRTIRIGDQIWMASDLRVTRYNDGTPIPLIEDNLVWGKLNSPAYCWYNNNQQVMTFGMYGVLYNGYVINTGKLAPKGWHIPTVDEIEQLCEYLGGIRTLSGYDYVGEMLKVVDTLYWMRPNFATNSSGFSAVGGGVRGSAFIGRSWYGEWWLQSGSFMMFNNYHYLWIDIDGGNSAWGKTVRCIKD